MARDLFDKEKIKFSEKDLDVIKQKTPDNYQVILILTYSCISDTLSVHFRLRIFC